jgi:hypothetical protein
MHNSQEESDLPAELASPARRALTQASYQRLEQLTSLGEAEIKQLNGVGPKALEQLGRALVARGLAFADEKQEK